MGLHSCHCLAVPAQRRAILQATLVPEGKPLFCALLRCHRQKAYLLPNEGVRSLTSVAVRQAQIELLVVQSALQAGA